MLHLAFWYYLTLALVEQLFICAVEVHYGECHLVCIRSKLLPYMYIFQAELRTGIIFLVQIANPLEICDIKQSPSHSVGVWTICCGVAIFNSSSLRFIAG